MTASRFSQRAVLGSVGLAALLVVLGLAATQLVTLLIATMITIILSLPLSWCGRTLERVGLPRPVGALIGLVAGLAALCGLVALLLPQLITQVTDLINATPGVVRTIEAKVGQITGQRPGHVATKLQSTITTYVHQPSHVLGPIATVGLSAATIIGGLAVAIVTAYYIAAQPDPLTNALGSLFPATRRPDVERVMERLRLAWLGWLRGLGAAMTIIGVLLYLCLQLIVGLPFALTFAVLGGLAEIIPYLGALASGIIPTAYALTISPGTAIAVVIIYVVVHQVEANLIGPLVMSRAVHLHPAVIALGVIAVGEVFGLLGLIVAVPIISTISILAEELWVRPQEQREQQRTAQVEAPVQT